MKKLIYVLLVAIIAFAAYKLLMKTETVTEETVVVEEVVAPAPVAEAPVAE